MEAQCKHSESVIKLQTNGDRQNTPVYKYKEGPTIKSFHPHWSYNKTSFNKKALVSRTAHDMAT
jgi:hypothetical protein